MADKNAAPRGEPPIGDKLGVKLAHQPGDISLAILNLLEYQS